MVANIMCAIAGIVNMKEDLRHNYKEVDKVVTNMGMTMTHRGPDDFRTIVDESIAFAHARLAVIDIEGGAQPMTKIGIGREYRILAADFYVSKCPLKIIDNFNRFTIVYNGELYNMNKIRERLIKKGYEFETFSDTEVILNSYIEYGEKCVDYLNGIFAFAIWDSKKKEVFLARDRFGVKPLFYTVLKDNFIFGSEIKALLEFPGFRAKIDEEGLSEIFGIGPARTPGCGVFKEIRELKPGYAMIISPENTRTYRYYQIKAYHHRDNYKQTVEHTWELLNDAITNQLISDVPLCTLLSGGLDSSIVSAASARFLRERGEQLSTYSFEFENNDIYFQSNKFQPESDDPYAKMMAEHINSDHRVLTCSNQELYDCLYDAVRAKDLPGMADVDSSMLYFARKMKQNHTVCLSGECADEVFGGYPWFRDEQWFSANRPLTFPWTKNLSVRKSILNDSVNRKLKLDEYVANAFEQAIADTPKLAGESKKQERAREINYLNIRHFMTTLLDRKDRTTMYSGLEVRVPFADHRLVEYVYNVPWEYKFHKGQVKGLLRDSAGFLLPEKVRKRKKSPYPKTYDPEYDRLLREEVHNILNKKSLPIHELINHQYIQKMLDEDSNVVSPWFGQLMAGPQMLAYIIQINYWLGEYNIDIL